MKNLFILLTSFFMLTACAPSPEIIQTAVASTLTRISTQTPVPTQTPYPTDTPKPPVIVTTVFIWTPINDPNNTNCIPITGMDYSDNSKIAIELQAYVLKLPGVKSVSYVIPERIYSNRLSELFFVQYLSSSDGKTYSKRYIAYISEFGWEKAVFSIDGQCWIDPPHY